MIIQTFISILSHSIFSTNSLKHNSTYKESWYTHKKHKQKKNECQKRKKKSLLWLDAKVFNKARELFISFYILMLWCCYYYVCGTEGKLLHIKLGRSITEKKIAQKKFFLHLKGLHQVCSSGKTFSAASSWKFFFYTTTKLASERWWLEWG